MASPFRPFHNPLSQAVAGALRNSRMRSLGRLDSDEFRRTPPNGPRGEGWHRTEFPSARRIASLALGGLSRMHAVRPRSIVPYVTASRRSAAIAAVFRKFVRLRRSRWRGLRGEYSSTSKPWPANQDRGQSLTTRKALGATDAPTQAAILSLYDPDRSRAPTQGGQSKQADGRL